MTSQSLKTNKPLWLSCTMWSDAEKTRSRRPQRPRAISPFFQHLIFDSCNPSRVLWASQVDMTCKCIGICSPLMSFSSIYNGRNSYFCVPIVSKNRLLCFSSVSFHLQVLPSCRIPLTSHLWPHCFSTQNLKKERVRSYLRRTAQRRIKSVLKLTWGGVHSVASRAC